MADLLNGFHSFGGGRVYKGKGGREVTKKLKATFVNKGLTPHSERIKNQLMYTKEVISKIFIDHPQHDCHCSESL